MAPLTTSTAPSRAAVLVPVKAFAVAKLRLAPVLGVAERAELARELAERVVAAACPLPVVVACDDEAVAAWAASVGARVVWTPGLGLNGAVQEGVAVLAAEGLEEVVVAHADLPLARGLSGLFGWPGVTLVPDRRDDGTNVACLPARCRFRFSYGPGSFSRHVAEVRRLHLPLRIARLPELQWDVDTPADLPVPATRGSSS